jgi:flagellum-specific peptidoglycan hydrolase FlgJ
MKITILMLMISISLQAQKYKNNPVAHKALGKVLLEIDSDRVSCFINKHYKAAKRLELNYGIPPALTIAQAALESGWGKSRLATEDNNYFGVRRNHKNMKYSSISKSFEDYAGILQNRCYNLHAPKNLQEWMQALKECGYCTKKGYTAHLNQIIKKYNLAIL